MPTETLLYIIISGIIALLLALFQYYFKARKQRLNPLYTFLRFITYFGVLLLLVNPKFEQRTYYTEKPNLVVAVDNSNSIAHLKQSEAVSELTNYITNHTELQDKFNVNVYNFGTQLTPGDSLGFLERQTNISKVFKELGEVYKQGVSPMLLITDGNQTYGSDYTWASAAYKHPIHPVIVGDTTVYSDLKISQLNVNKYAYLKNKFPVEAIVNYSGTKPVTTRFIVTSGRATVYSKSLNFSKDQTAQILNFNLPANAVGVQSYRAQIVPLASEKNTINNSKPFAVEVIDQKTNIAIVSDILHPDLGALKKSIESNEQRSVSFLSPQEAVRKLDDFQLFVLYQPTAKFKALYDKLNAANSNRFVIVGTQTHLPFLNSVSSYYKQAITDDTEDFQASLNANYSNFIVEQIAFESFPPLTGEFGEATFSVPQEPMVYKRINAIETEQPLLSTFEANGRREAVLFGEGIWTWRAQSFINQDNFIAFDNIIGKLVQYLASNTRKKRLNLDYQSFYEGATNVIIKAQFFNKNYEFDANETLQITVKNKADGSVKTLPFVLKNTTYQVDLSHLKAGDYSFTVKASRENISASGRFKILEYNIEQQFLNANVTPLQTIASNTKGSSAFINNYKTLIDALLTDERNKPIAKSHKKVVPLIDFKYLLGLIALSLALEWFIRKYNGLT